MTLPRSNVSVQQPGSPGGRAARSRATLGLFLLGIASVLLYSRSLTSWSARERLVTGAVGRGTPDFDALATNTTAPAPVEVETAGWASSYLHKQADPVLNPLVDNSSRAHRYARCDARSFQLARRAAWNSSAELEALLSAEGALGKDPRAQDVVEALVDSVPCSHELAEGRASCCQHTFFFRPNTTDFKVFRQIYQWHYMRYLYAIFERQPPRYILDAGGNAGFSTVLFKLLWPDALVVVVEPDPGNFEALERQVAGLEGVHPLRAALWGHKAKVAQVAKHDGDWGRIFKALDPGQSVAGAMQAYGVKDIAQLYSLPPGGFDFVKIDVEGAEGMIFDPETADLSWIDGTNVLSLEVHDYFAGYFGMKEVSTRIEAAMRGRPFAIVSDNEHVVYLGKKALKGFQDAITTN